MLCRLYCISCWKSAFTDVFVRTSWMICSLHRWCVWTDRRTSCSAARAQTSLCLRRRSALRRCSLKGKEVAQTRHHDDNRGENKETFFPFFCLISTFVQRVDHCLVSWSLHYVSYLFILPQNRTWGFTVTKELAVWQTLNYHMALVSVSCVDRWWSSLWRVTVKCLKPFKNDSMEHLVYKPDVVFLQLYGFQQVDVGSPGMGSIFSSHNVFGSYPGCWPTCLF